MLIRVLLLADSAALVRRLTRLLGGGDVLIDSARPRQGPWEQLARDTYDLLLIGEEALREPVPELVATLGRLPEPPEVVFLQQRDDPARRDELLASGCLAVVFTGLPDPLLAQTLLAVVDRRRESAVSRLRAERREQFRLADFASQSTAMQRLLGLARRVVASDSSLLILGETGVGKEWLARAIHAEGKRATAPFIAVNCAAVPDALLESELFGHEKGAFTGAVRSRRGYFELAHRGTVFLDEIADMTPHLQAKLLRVLQERKLQRLGAEAEIAIDVRIMAATNRDLEQAMTGGSFRRDLYYRLGVVTLTIPPLRERREDVAALARSYLAQFSQQLGRGVKGIEDQALELLEGYAWPGNVRELINVVERCVLLAQGELITVADLPEALVGARPPAAGRAPVGGAESAAPPRLADWLDMPLARARRQVADQFERAYLSEQLRRTEGRIGDTAHRCGITPRALYGKMRRHGLRKEDFRAASPGTYPGSPSEPVRKAG